MPDKSAINDEYISKVDETNVKIDHQEQPEFMRDVLPYFQPFILQVGVFLAFWYTGNIVTGAWLMYVGTPLYNYFMLYDDHNISHKNEKVWMENQFFVIPMVVYEFS